ncbi:unnamed protein product [Rotaria sp. Silwood1]|nr:unnamed protein product [Rotaria sp. Silwood1]CAF3401056.1 unnamed protein product [Rotaria sp. Silwood1]CAF3401453.1 unnamed protein product [Rotaria sp. Silwood1]CAF4779320.1 unnamed protein product [Rotaria sp. Silwood1]
MADSSSSLVDSSIINNDQSIQICDIETSSTDKKWNKTISANSKIITKRKMTYKEHREVIYKLNQIKQVIHEENLIHEKINRINLEKQHVRSLLLLLHVVDSIDGMKYSQHG